MAQKKKIRFDELLHFPNVLQNPENMAGNWKAFFGNDRRITLELACGKGEYAVGMGRLYADRNFLGVDIKGNRIWVGAKKALQEGMKNVGFLRTQIDRIDAYFSKGEVQDIWITFPDPQLRLSRAKKRLTHPIFLRRYQQFLEADSYIHVKTDSPVLYAFTRTVADLYGIEVLVAEQDLYKTPPTDPVLSIPTHYEQLDIAKSSRVHYLKLKLPRQPLPDRDEQLKEYIRERETQGGY
jgi:tRNA (guanine-N7-)-methyltransferase